MAKDAPYDGNHLECQYRDGIRLAKILSVMKKRTNNPGVKVDLQEILYQLDAIFDIDNSIELIYYAKGFNDYLNGGVK